MKFIVICGLILCAVLCVSEAAINETLEAKYPNLHLILVNPQNKSETAPYTLQNLTSILSNSWFSRQRGTVIYAFGFTGSISIPTTQVILDAYVKRGGNNIIVVDWSEYNGVVPNDYPAAIANMKEIGGIVGARIAATFKNFLTLRFHLVGHSLGAHLVAYINRAIPRSFLTPPIPKIIALDPAGPYMYNASYNNTPLNPYDALIVQVIHTDMFAAGAPVKCGKIDFYPNGGGLDGVQPGCLPFDAANLFSTANFCSHQKSVYYYAESVATKGNSVFAAVRCSNYNDFKAGKCRIRSQQMGLSANDFIHGDFYLQTNKEAPYDRGTAGIVYSNSTA